MKNSFIILLLVSLCSFGSLYTIEPIRFYLHEASQATEPYTEQVYQELKDYLEMSASGLMHEFKNYNALNSQTIESLLLALVNYDQLNKIFSQEFKLNNSEIAHSLAQLARASLNAGILAAASYKRNQLANIALKDETKLCDAITKYEGQILKLIKNKTLTIEKIDYTRELLELAIKELKQAMTYTGSTLSLESLSKEII